MKTEFKYKTNISKDTLDKALKNNISDTIFGYENDGFEKDIQTFKEDKRKHKKDSFPVVVFISATVCFIVWVIWAVIFYKLLTNIL